MNNIKQICIELANLARREHYFCEDSWYSCPKAEGGCANDAEGDKCICGADAHNAKVNELLAAALAKSEPQRRYLYNPVQIAECGGPCQQGPEHCDCGELCVTEPASEPPTDGEVVELVAWLLEGGEDAAANGWDHQARQFARAAELLQLQHPQPDFAPCLPAVASSPINFYA